ncbi:MAG TPA: CBS domain-containing protein [Thermoguttaceae bacterium]|nr:CBS domain-containing protein [Thermoguttaceae bacterium]
MILQDILSAKGTEVYTIAPDATLAEAAHTLVEHKVGALLVSRPDETGKQQLLGIFTERDLLYFCAARECTLSSVQVAEIMTTDLITGSPGDSVEQVMGLMTTKRIRHLPVLVEGRLSGIVSIGDIVKAQHDRLALENRFMKDYIQR